MSRSEFFVVDMPLNKNGQGPEIDESKIAEVRWQIWDRNSFECKGEYSTEAEAIYECSKLIHSI